MGNEAQRERWDGDQGRQWVAEAARYDRLNRRFGDHVRTAAAAEPGQRILDVGCGAGRLSLDLATEVAPSGEVLGVDISGPLLDLARERATEAGLTNARFEQADAQTTDFPDGTFDTMVSRFGIMFFDEPVAAFANIRSALRAGGKAAFACWQGVFENEWLTVPTMAALEHLPIPTLGDPHDPGPFAFADRDRLQGILEQAGFGDIEISDVREPVCVGDDPDDALAFYQRTEFAETMFADADPEKAALAWEGVARALADRATPDGVFLGGAAWLVTARRP